MDPFFRLILLGAAMLPWGNPARANAANDASEAPRCGVTLAASAIDSSALRVGTPAIVIYGLGLRDPVTGKWPRLTQEKGVIQAVDSRRLLLTREKGGVQRIDLARIQTLIVEETSVSLSASQDTVQAQADPVDSLAGEETAPSGSVSVSASQDTLEPKLEPRGFAGGEGGTSLLVGQHRSPPARKGGGRDWFRCRCDCHSPCCSVGDMGGSISRCARFWA